jgi:flagellar basal body-associated protein FliL
MAVTVPIFIVVVLVVFCAGVVGGLLWAASKALDEIDGFDESEGEGRG